MVFLPSMDFTDHIVDFFLTNVGNILLKIFFVQYTRITIADK